MEHPLLRFRLAFTLLAIVIVIGVTGYMLIDGWNILDAFYMVIITISSDSTITGFTLPGMMLEPG